MKKIIAIALIVAMIMLCATGCNSESEGDAPSTRYEYAYISLSNSHIVEVALKDFYRYKNHIMILGQDGTFYSVSYNNCILTNIQLDYTESEK